MKKYHLPYLLLLLFFIISYLYLGIQRHNRFQSGDDLALNCQTVWLYSRSLPPISSLINANVLTNHFSLIFPLISPLYKIFPDPKILILLQEFTLALGSLPIYLTALKFLKNKSFSLVITFLYLFFIGIQSAASFDIQSTIFSTTFLSFTMYFALIKKWRLYFISLILSLICKEDMPSYTFAFGIFLIIFQKERKVGLITSAFSLFYYYSIYHFFLPAFTGIPPVSSSLGGKSYILDILLKSPPEFFKTFVSTPEKLRNIFLTSFSFGFLPNLSPLYWLMAPINFLRFFSDDPARHSLHFHYTAPLTPILASSAILTLQKIKKERLKVSFILLAIIGTIYTNKPHLDPYFDTPPISYIFRRSFFVLPPRNKDFEKILSLIPKDVSVSAQTPLTPHLCNRESLYQFPKNYENAQYIALTFTESPYPITAEEMEKLKTMLLSDKNYENLYQSYAGVLLKRKAN